MATGEEVINYLYGAYIRHLERERMKTKIQRDNERLCNMITCYPRPSDPIEIKLLYLHVFALNYSK